MNTLKAVVRNGRLVMDEPTELPEGSAVDLTIADSGDDLDDEERAALHTALDRSWADAKAGLIRPAAEILKELKGRE
jgi:hypothetical protein